MAIDILKNKKFIKIFLWIAIIVTIFCVVMSYFRKNIVPVIVETCKQEVKAIAVNSVHNATSTVITEDLKYEDLFDIQKNKNDEITLIQARVIEINKIAHALARLTQSNLESVNSSEISIPFGTLTGITMFIGIGPDVSINIIPIGVANCDFISEFVSAGINQTVHKIYIDIYITMMVALPIEDISVDIKSEIVVCENLIIGKVPDTYLDMGRITRPINLIP